MNTIIKIAILIIIFATGYTMGQGHYPLDFDGNKVITGNDVKTALQHLTSKQ